MLVLLFTSYCPQFFQQDIELVSVQLAEPLPGYPPVLTKCIDSAPVGRVNTKQLHLMENGASLLT